MERRRIALFGAWHVHAEGYLKTAIGEGAEIIGVYDADPARRAKIAAAYGVPELPSEEALLTSCADGAIVCTATSDHPRVIAALAGAGKDVFTEKVLAITDREAEETAAAVKRAGVSFVISFPDLFSSWMQTAYAVLRDGKLGKVTSIRFKNCHTGSSGRWLPPHFYSREQCGGGAMIDLGAHGMYVIASILGVPDAFVSRFTCVMPEVQPDPAHPVEDNAVTLMTWRDGCVATNETGFVTKGFPKTLEITGTDGSLLWNGETMTLTDPGSGKPVGVPLLPALPSPLVQFLRRQTPAGCGIDEGVRLTRMMTGAYDGLPDSAQTEKAREMI